MNGLKFGKYTFTCRLDAPAILPAYKGSTFRGVFGLALKKVVCALKHQTCETCQLRKRCLYTQVFETALAVQPPDGLRVSVAPHPFVLQPSLSNRQAYPAGEALQCDLLLFGPVNENFSYFVYAFDQMGRIGIGRKINGKRAGFTLETVNHGEHVMYSANTRAIDQRRVADSLTLTPGAVSSDDVLRLTVTLETPLRLKFKNRINNADLPFHVLIRAMLRRVSALFACYAGAEPALDYKGMLDRAASVKIVDGRLKWYSWQRYSNRQKQRMPLGGMIGSVTYEGKLAEYLPLMNVCSHVHIGKNTSFGLGKLGFCL
ncbi:MAG: CRISPR-associated protein Cas6 [Deltaproteobacteria bacterium]|nr:MAG: CRISPR-associated protein Cas6 [Deltaproteobacteria bacterium]